MSPPNSPVRTVLVATVTGYALLWLLCASCAVPPVMAFDYIVEPGPEIIATKGACVDCSCICFFLVEHMCNRKSSAFDPLRMSRRNLAKTGAPEQYGQFSGVASALVSIQCKPGPAWKCVICCRRRFIRALALFPNINNTQTPTNTKTPQIAHQQHLRDTE